MENLIWNNAGTQIASVVRAFLARREADKRRSSKKILAKWMRSVYAHKKDQKQFINRQSIGSEIEPEETGLDT